MSGFYSILAEGGAGSGAKGKQRAKKGKKRSDDAPAAEEPEHILVQAPPAVQPTVEAEEANGWAKSGRGGKAKGAAIAQSGRAETHSRQAAQPSTVTVEAACQSIETQASAASGDERVRLWRNWTRQVMPVVPADSTHLQNAPSGD